MKHNNVRVKIHRGYPVIMWRLSVTVQSANKYSFNAAAARKIIAMARDLCANLTYQWSICRVIDQATAENKRRYIHYPAHQSYLTDNWSTTENNHYIDLHW